MAIISNSAPDHCIHCQSKNINSSTEKGSRGTIYFMTECLDCGCAFQVAKTNPYVVFTRRWKDFKPGDEVGHYFALEDSDE